MTDEKKLFDELALDANPAMAAKAKIAKRMMDDVRTNPEEARQFHLWRGIYAQTHGKVPDVADAFMAATVRERMMAQQKIQGLETLIRRLRDAAVHGSTGSLAGDVTLAEVLADIKKAGIE